MIYLIKLPDGLWIYREMVDAQYAPLTATLVRTLTDKLYEKRKAAALDIEKFDSFCLAYIFVSYVMIVSRE